MRDKVLENLIKAEIKRQKETLDLIPSENIASEEVLRVVGSPLINKYSEGYPRKRYYPGNKYYDAIEELAQERARKAFRIGKNWHVNVQPYSGSPANAAVYFGLLNFGDTLMGLALASGGHLTHGHKVSFSGKAYKGVQYSVDPRTGLLNYDEVERLAREHRPKIIVSGLTAYPRAIDFRRFHEIARSVGAYHLADVSHIAGLIAGGALASPFPWSDVVMMTTHKTLRGPRGAVLFMNRESEVAKKNGVDIAQAVDRGVFPGMQGGPHNNVTAGIARMFFEALRPDFKIYAKQVVKNAKVLADELMRRGFTLFTNGTDNHLMLINAVAIGLDGMTAEKRLEENGIIANRNSLPGDPSPFKPSGVRMGTPSLTSRGMKEREMKEVAELIHAVLMENKKVLGEVKKLCRKFPLPY